MEEGKMKKAKSNFLTEKKLKQIIEDCKKKNDWSKLTQSIDAVFSDPDAIISSFRCEDDDTLPKKTYGAMQLDFNNDIDDYSKYTTVNLPSVRRAFAELNKIPAHLFKDSLIVAISLLGQHPDVRKNHKQRGSDPNYINIFVILMEIPFLAKPEFIDSSLPDICNMIGHLSLSVQGKLATVWSHYEPEQLRNMIRPLHELITDLVMKGVEQWKRGLSINDNNGITGAAKVMKIIYYASLHGELHNSKELVNEEKDLNFQQDPLSKVLGISHVHCQKPLVPFEHFVNHILNEHFNVDTDLGYYKSNRDKFSFVNYSFLLTTASKHEVMKLDSTSHMFDERMSCLVQTLVNGIRGVPYLRIVVRRDHLIEDAMKKLEEVARDNPQDLKKQLYIEFSEEQALDEGGVSKEFFQLVVADIFNPVFGMFTYKEETRQFWFNPASLENDAEFTFIGIVLGLAIYNSMILDINFPMVVYKKLMGKKGIFEDLKEFEPQLASSLQKILDCQDEPECDNFIRSYTDVFGEVITQNLKKDGDKIEVNNDNKEEFVRLYADHLMNSSVEKQFSAFMHGFHMVTRESPLLALFRPEELELLVCGSKDFDMRALVGATMYDGYTSNSDTIWHFWSVVQEFTEEQQRKLLQFTTGTDRVPIGGLSNLRLTISWHGNDENRLPASHTCYNILLLPAYKSARILKDRLSKAIECPKGFGML